MAPADSLWNDSASAADQFTYVDTARGGVDRRNDIRQFTSVVANGQTDCYVSHSRATEDLLTWVKNHKNRDGKPTVAGFDGPTWTDNLHVDIDAEGNLGLALNRLREVLRRLDATGVDLRAVRLYFSGSKGFHLEIPHTLFGGFKPSKDLHKRLKRAASRILGDIPFDPSVYDRLRLWRLENTRHGKSGLFKVRLTLTEALTADPDAILALASGPRQAGGIAELATPPDDEWFPVDELVAIWESTQVTDGSSEPELSRAPTDTARVRQTVAAIAASWPQGGDNAIEGEAGAGRVSRHADYLLALGGFLARRNSAADVIDILAAGAEQAGDPTFLSGRDWQSEIARIADGAVARIGRGEEVRGLPALAKHFPSLAKVLDALWPDEALITRPRGGESPRPLFRALPDPEPFPTEALGPVLEPAARAIARVIRSHPAMIGQTMLATAALAVQAHANVKLPTRQVKPLSLYCVTVADSGERKTSTDNEASRGVRAFVSDLLNRYRDERRTYDDKQAAWESTRTSILRTKGQTLTDRETQLRDLGPPPTKPPIPMVTCTEPTYEGLVALFESGRPSLGLFSSEGGQFVGGFAMSDDHWLKTCAAFSGLWDGDDISRVRKGDGAAVLPGRRLSLHLLMQPTVAPRLLANAEIAGQGFLARVLVSAPPSLAGTRMGQEATAADYIAIETFSGQLQAILKREPTTGTDGGLTLRTLPLTADAERRWWTFSDNIEQQIGVGKALVPIKAFGAKMAEHAARVGANLQLIEDIEAQALDKAHLERGITLVEYYASEWLRLHEAQATSEHLLHADRLRLWLQTVWKEDVIGLPEVYQLGPSSLRDAATARAAMRTLEDHGWVVSLPDGARIDGKLRREAWSIVRSEE